MKVVNLIRRFDPASYLSREWDLIIDNRCRPQGWHNIDDEYRVLIIAAPGAGKTFEAKARATKIREQGKKAFFIRIEKIDASFDQAFEIGTGDEFAAWLKSTEEAWFFLDSVDEAQLETPRALENAVRIFGTVIHDALERAHIFITSREDAWRALPDQTLIEQYLPYGAPSCDDEHSGDQGNPMLKRFRLAGLSEDQIALFSSRYGISDTSEFIEAIKRANLLSLAERPFDLKALISVWIADRKLGSRFDVLQRMINLQLDQVCRGSGPIRIDREKAHFGACVLAAAVMLTGKAVISIQNGKLSPDRIDSTQLLPDWTGNEINALLRTGLFDDIVYTSVRFRHREIRELLAAEWANILLNQPGRRAQIEHLFFRDSHGEEVIVPRTRPALPWLILLDKDIRDKALSLDPEIASEGGDPSRLPLEIKRNMLYNIVRKIAQKHKV